MRQAYSLCRVSSSERYTQGKTDLASIPPRYPQTLTGPKVFESLVLNLESPSTQQCPAGILTGAGECGGRGWTKSPSSATIRLVVSRSGWVGDQSVTTSPRVNWLRETDHRSRRTTSWCIGEEERLGLNVGWGQFGDRLGARGDIETFGHPVEPVPNSSTYYEYHWKGRPVLWQQNQITHLHAGARDRSNRVYMASKEDSNRYPSEDLAKR